MLSHLKFIACLVLFTACATSSSTSQKASDPSRETPPLHLILGLDGVGYETMKRLYEGGYFREFYPPSPMVASFPSLSDPNWARLMRAPITESYQKSYFDIKVKTSTGVGQPIGGLINHIMEPPPYEVGFDFKAEGALQHLAVMTWTTTSALYWLDSLEHALYESRGKDTYFAFIINTDILAHVQGEKALLEYLVEVDRRLMKLRRRIQLGFGHRMDITIVSDHGNYWIKPIQVDYETPLEQKGWKIKDTLEGPNDVGFVVPEIVSFASLFTLPGQEKRLAYDFSSIDGVLVANYLLSPNVIETVANGGADVAQITIDPKAQTAQYHVTKGKDVLKQLEYFKGKPRSWKDYFSDSCRSDYPYAAVRIWEGFHRNAKTAGSVLVSPKLGHVFANKTLNMLVALKGLASTHGGLHRLETNGVLISTKEPYAPIRPDDFGILVDLKRYRANLP